MLDQQREMFREEAAELLTELEESLLELEEAPDDQELVAKVFRAMHTIKGSGAMFGFDEVAAFTHEVETVYDLVRGGTMQVTQDLINLSLAARDHIRGLLDPAAEEGVDRVAGNALVEQFKALVPQADPPAAQKTREAEENQSGGDGESWTYRIRMKLAENIVFSGTRPDSLIRELSDLGACRIVAQTDMVPLLEDYAPESLYVYWDVVLTTDRGVNAIRDVFIFVEDDVELKIDIIDGGDSGDGDVNYKRIGEILLDRGDITSEELDRILGESKPIGQKLIDSKNVDPGKIEVALYEQEMVRASRAQRQSQEAAATVRVPADRLDRLVDLVGEMVTIQSRMSQTAIGRDDADLISIAEEVERLTDELRDNTLSLRMLPIGTTFSKFKRLVRDLSQELGKEIELVTAGAETELDKTVIEKLNDPLVHLIRNSIDHGIEAPQIRVSAGKKRHGTIRLAAIHSGDSVIIEINDDGAGLNQERIRAKAIEKGIISDQDQLGPQDLYQLILASGFSTAGKVTGVSGRGVGMDVVRRAIEALRGTINIDSNPGVGTTIRVQIPLTLAIIESLLVGIGKERYVLPLALVEECIELTRNHVHEAHGRNLVRVRDQLIPYLPLRRSFAIGGDQPAIEQVVITCFEGQRVGLVVDRVIGEHQTVIKPLGRIYRDAQGISGATILGDGGVALILDVPQLLAGAEDHEDSNHSS